MLTIAPLVLILDLPWSTYYEYPGLNYHQENGDNQLPKLLVITYLLTLYHFFLEELQGPKCYHKEFKTV